MTPEKGENWVLRGGMVLGLLGVIATEYSFNGPGMATANDEARMFARDKMNWQPKSVGLQ